jgi:hypothetical protein
LACKNIEERSRQVNFNDDEFMSENNDVEILNELQQNNTNDATPSSTISNDTIAIGFDPKSKSPNFYKYENEEPGKGAKYLIGKAFY